MKKQAFITSLLMLNSLLACGPQQEVGQKVNVNPTIVVNVDTKNKNVSNSTSEGTSESDANSESQSKANPTPEISEPVPPDPDEITEPVPEFSEPENIDEEEAFNAIFATIEAYVFGFSERNLEAVLNALHPQSPFRAQFEEEGEQIFDACPCLIAMITLDTLEDVQVINIEGDTAHVEVTRLTADQFEEPLSEVVNYELKLHDGDWLLFDFILKV